MSLTFNRTAFVMSLENFSGLDYAGNRRCLKYAEQFFVTIRQSRHERRGRMNRLIQTMGIRVQTVPKIFDKGWIKMRVNTLHVCHVML